MVLPLAAASDPARVGGKAAGLAALVADGERVPPGFVVPADGVETLVVADLAPALAGLGCDAVAVRSSGRFEDGTATAQAGAHLTRLGVPADPPAVLAAVREVAASGEQVSVLVQAMVRAAAAGVAFSVDPVTGDEVVVVTVVRGTGERLMSGEVEGETWRVIATGTEEPPVAEAPLSPAAVERVADAVRRLRAARDHHVDVEFAVEQDGMAGERLVLLQCRPVTAVPVPPELVVPPGPWEKDVAHSPGPLSPMTASLDVAGGFAPAWAARFGLIVKDVRTALIGGEEYSQVVPVVGSAEGGGAPPPAWLLGVLARVVPPLRARMRTARRVLDDGLLDDLPRRWDTEWRPEFVATNERLRRTDRAAIGDAELLEHVDTTLEHVRRGVAVHFDLFIPYLVGVHGFVRAAERHLGWDATRSLQALAGWSPASAVAGDRLREIGAWLRRTPGAVEALHSTGGSTEEVVASLCALEPQLADALAGWLAREGFRLVDYDVAAPSLTELPDLLGGLLAEAASGTDDRPALRERERALVEEAASDLSEAARAELRAAYARACAVFGLREDNVRLTCLAPLAALRWALLEVGRRLVDRGQLGEADDVMMLRLGEARAALRESPAEDRRATVARRRAEQAWVRAHPGPLRHGPESGPPPDLSRLPRAGRVLNEALMWGVGQELSPPPEQGRTEGVLVSGTPCGPGTHTGVARVVRGSDDFERLRPGDVLVCPVATPAWAALFPLVGAVVCDGGGPLSHTAIIAREHGLPTIMGAGDATTRLTDGTTVQVDGAAGTVTAA